MTTTLCLTWITVNEDQLILAVAWSPHQVFFGAFVAIAFAYSLFCVAMCFCLKKWGRAVPGKLQREYTITRKQRSKDDTKRTKCFDIGYSVDGRDYVVTLKTHQYTITIGLGRLRRAVMKGMIVYYFPHRPQKGYVLRDYVSHAIYSAAAGVILLLFLYWES